MFSLRENKRYIVLLTVAGATLFYAFRLFFSVTAEFVTEKKWSEYAKENGLTDNKQLPVLQQALAKREGGWLETTDATGSFRQIDDNIIQTTKLKIHVMTFFPAPVGNSKFGSKFIIEDLKGTRLLKYVPPPAQYNFFLQDNHVLVYSDNINGFYHFSVEGGELQFIKYPIFFKLGFDHDLFLHNGYVVAVDSNHNNILVYRMSDGKFKVLPLRLTGQYPSLSCYARNLLFVGGKEQTIMYFAATGGDFCAPPAQIYKATIDFSKKLFFRSIHPKLVNRINY